MESPQGGETLRSIAASASPGYRALPVVESFSGLEASRERHSTGTRAGVPVASTSGRSIELASHPYFYCLVSFREDSAQSFTENSHADRCAQKAAAGGLGEQLDDAASAKEEC
jgi:hypothetical protein